MLDMVVETVSNKPVAALALLSIWLLWRWAGARLIQGLIVGRASKNNIADMNLNTLSFYSVVLIALIGSGVYMGGVIL